MDAPLIAIIGSAQADRKYEPELVQPKTAKQAAVELGRELANKGFRILVYSSDPRFIEADFVQGFASVSKTPQSIEVRHPIKENTQFKEQKDQSQSRLFVVRPEKGDWEMSFYLSLQDVDGIILMGGGSPTLIAGILAIKDRIPLLSIATFGGKARIVWELIPDNFLVTEFEKSQMAAQWNPQSSAKEWVRILSNQREALQKEKNTKKRREKAQSRTTQWYALLSAVIFVVAVAIAVVGLSGMVTSYGILLGLLFFCPLVAGISGATIRTAFDWTQASPTQNNRTLLSTAALGLVVGGLSGVLFIVAQMTTIPALPGQDDVVTMITETQTQRLIPFALVIGFIGGLTLDAVVRKLIDSDIVDTKALVVLGTPDRSQKSARPNG